MRKTAAVLALGIFVAALAVPFQAFAHPGHAENDAPVILAARDRDEGDSDVATQGISGQGNLRFKVLHTSAHLPAEAQAVLEKAHGGFAIDRRPGKGETYFALPGAGIIQVSADLTSTKMVSTPDDVKNTNMHNTTIWYGDDGVPYLTFPANETAKVFTTTVEGDLVNTLDAPTGDTLFDVEAVSTYFQEDGKFVPTDVDILKGLFYVTTGYSPLDYVLTAKVASNGAVSSSWTPLAFGGRGDGPGQFGTGHGVVISPDKTRVEVADRPNSEIDRFTPEGGYIDTVKLPAGSFPCDIDYEAGYAIVGCLHGPDREKGAPIYLLKDDTLVSTIMPKEELGLEKFTHIHNAVLHEISGKLYIFAQAWNPGDFAILEQVAD